MSAPALTLALRPRGMFESVDLGTRMVQLHARLVWRVYAVPALIVGLLAMASMQAATWAPTLVIFMAKPWLDRALLLVYSRVAFAVPVRATDAWRPGVLLGLRPVLSALTWRRLSPWRSFTQAIEQLEGQRGAAYRSRRKLLLQGQRWNAMVLQSLYSQLEWLLVGGWLSLALWLQPGLNFNTMFENVFGDEASATMQFASQLAYVLSALALEPFFVAGGFSMYLSRRIDLEAWDIEQAMRHAFAD